MSLIQILITVLLTFFGVDGQESSTNQTSAPTINANDNAGTIDIVDIDRVANDKYYFK